MDTEAMTRLMQTSIDQQQRLIEQTNQLTRATTNTAARLHVLETAAQALLRALSHHVGATPAAEIHAALRTALQEHFQARADRPQGSDDESAALLAHELVSSARPPAG
jgi:hypothetical protein